MPPSADWPGRVSRADVHQGDERHKDEGGRGCHHMDRRRPHRKTAPVALLHCVPAGAMPAVHDGEPEQRHQHQAGPERFGRGAAGRIGRSRSRESGRTPRPASAAPSRWPAGSGGAAARMSVPQRPTAAAGRPCRGAAGCRRRLRSRPTRRARQVSAGWHHRTHHPLAHVAATHARVAAHGARRTWRTESNRIPGTTGPQASNGHRYAAQRSLRDRRAGAATARGASGCIGS